MTACHSYSLPSPGRTHKGVKAHAGGANRPSYRSRKGGEGTLLYAWAGGTNIPSYQVPGRWALDKYQISLYAITYKKNGFAFATYMKKVISILSFALAFAATGSLSPLAAEENSGAGTVNGPVLVNAGDLGVEQGHKPFYSGSQTDLDIFRDNAVDHPDVSAAALVRLLAVMPENEVKDFRRKNCGKIVEMLAALDTEVKAGRVPAGDYSQLTAQLSPFRIHTIAFFEANPDGPSRMGPHNGQHNDGHGSHTGHHNGGERKPGVKPGTGNAGNSGDTDPDPVDALVQTRMVINSGDKDRTAEAIGKVRSEFPQNPSVQVAAATYYNETGDSVNAERTATDAIALDSGNPDAYKTRALARASLDDRKGAIEDIKKAMAINPQDESARVLSVLLESKKSAQTLKSVSSLQEMKRALGMRDDSVDAVNMGSGGAVGARIEEPAATASPDFARSKAYLKTALSKNRLGDYESAVSYASLAIEKDPANLEAYLERANAYNFMGRYDDAVRDTGHVIDKDPRNLQAYNMRAWALNRKGKSKEAETDASRAIGINPNFADAWFNRALSYEKQGDYKHMLEDFRQAAALSGAYSSRYQDAVAQYGPRVPGFANSVRPAVAASSPDGETARKGKPLRRFLLLMVLTLTGGGLVAMGLIHIVGGKEEQGKVSGRRTHPDVLSPSIFYEGVATGKYKIEKKVGEGGMGVVYLAVDQSLGRKVAIKKMNDEIKVNEREKQRFLDEARTVALLHHPNIVEIYTIFEEEDDIYLVFEYVAGRTFDKLLDSEARIPFERARSMLDETAKALAYAHSKGVVHRDLKLSNIMISEEGEVKVMDFGLARGAMESMARVSNKEVVGSPAYMAPEQELGVSSVESDVYSLGVCLYEAVSGVLPFQGPDFHFQKTHKAYQPLSETVPGASKELDALVDKCLAPEPENRFRNVEEFRRALNLAA